MGPSLSSPPPAEAMPTPMPAAAATATPATTTLVLVVKCMVTTYDGVPERDLKGSGKGESGKRGELGGPARRPQGGGLGGGSPKGWGPTGSGTMVGPTRSDGLQTSGTRENLTDT